MRCRVGTASAVVSMLLAVCGCGSSAASQSERSCGRTVLSDWADGRIDKTYPGPCYLAAIEELPEDVRAYTSAKDDISRALNSRRGGS